MHIKFLARGTGSARAAADYLLGARDATGQLREGVEVLRGDPHQVAAVADALAFEHKYTSGVIAWAPDDTPTDAQIEAVLDEFERTAWAGLEPDRYAWSAVVHRERDGGAHVHVLAARCDLETGRSLNIAPPGWQKTFGPLRTIEADTAAATGRMRSLLLNAWLRPLLVGSVTPSTPNRAGAGRMTRRGRGCSNPGTAPTSSPPPAT